MTKKIKVLIAIDYDSSAQKVAQEGYAIASSMNAEVILMHVVSEPVFYSSQAFSPITGFLGYINMKEVHMDSIDGPKIIAQSYLDKIKQHLDSDTVKTHISEGDFAEAILATAKDIHADAIVLGSHSRSRLENLLLGSVTEKVLKDTPIPLIIIPIRKNINNTNN